MIRDYTMTIPAGGQETRPVKGSLVGLMRCSIDTQIIRVHAFDDQGGEVINIGLYQGEKIPSGRPYTLLKFENTGAVAVTITVVAGEGSYQSDRLSGVVSVAGTVNVDQVVTDIDINNYQRSRRVTGAAGKYRGAVLFNPVGSGVVGYLERYTAHCVASPLHVYKTNYIKNEDASLGLVSELGTRSFADFSRWGLLKFATIESAVEKVFLSATNNGSVGIFIEQPLANERVEQFFQNGGIKISEGEAAFVSSDNINEEISASFSWSERTV